MGQLRRLVQGFTLHPGEHGSTLNEGGPSGNQEGRPAGYLGGKIDRLWQLFGGRGYVSQLETPT